MFDETMVNTTTQDAPVERHALQFSKVCPDVIQARKEAEEEYSAFFAEFHPYITRSKSSIIRDLYADYGMVGYSIQVDIEASEDVKDTMDQWLASYYHHDTSGYIESETCPGLFFPPS